jgi:hypothetical protein
MSCNSLIDLYYINPGCVPPEGLVLILCQEDLDQMMESLKGAKKCELYIVTNRPSSSDYSDDDNSEEVAYIANLRHFYKVFFTNYLCLLIYFCSFRRVSLNHTKIHGLAWMGFALMLAKGA